MYAIRSYYEVVALPALARATGWTLSAEWGRVGLDGRIEAREVRFDTSGKRWVTVTTS